MKCSTDVRVAALEALVEVVKADSRMADWEFLLEIIEHDPEPRVRHELLTLLASNPPFERGRGSRLDTIPVMERLWKQMKYIYLDICALFNCKIIVLICLVALNYHTTLCFVMISLICTTACMVAVNLLVCPAPCINE